MTYTHGNPLVHAHAGPSHAHVLTYTRAHTSSPEPRSRTASPDSFLLLDPYANSQNANCAGVHTAIMNAIRRTRSHVNLHSSSATEPEAPLYIDPSELYSPPPLPSLGDEQDDVLPQQRHNFQYKWARAQLKVDIAVHRAKKAVRRKVGLD